MPGQINVLTGTATVISPGATGGPLYLTKNGAGAPPYSFAGDTNTGLDSSAADTLNLVVGGSSVLQVSAAGTVDNTAGFLSTAGFSDYPHYRLSRQGSPGLQLASTSVVEWAQSADYTDTIDLVQARLGAGSLRQGKAPSATPAAQTFTLGEASRPGTDTNVGGSSGTLRSGLGTGTGTASSLIFQTPDLAASGSGTQAYATRLTIATAAITATVDIQGTTLGLSGRFSPASDVFLTSQIVLKGVASAAGFHGLMAGYANDTDQAFVGAALVLSSGANQTYRAVVKALVDNVVAIRSKDDAAYGTIDIVDTDYAGVGAGTITNAPAAGNPAKWLGIYAGGTLYKIPAWT